MGSVTGSAAALPPVVDLIVVGAGLAGHCAALEAAERGNSVLLLEKTAGYGGSTLQSSGSFAFADTAAQRDRGIQDSSELLWDDIMKASGGRADPALAELFVQHQAEAHAWLAQRDVQFYPIALSSNQGVPRTHPTDPRQLMRALNARVVANDRIRYRENVGALRLLPGPEGRVEGVRVRLPTGETTELAARRGIALTSGGFSRDRRTIQKFSPGLERALVLGGEGNTGDGLRMAWKLGGDVVDMPFISGTFGVSLNGYPRPAGPAEDDAMLLLSIYKGGIAVNRDAERFADESISYKTLGERCLAQPDGIGFQIWDQKIMDQSMPQPTSNDLEAAFDRGLARKADDLVSLARAVGLDGDRLQRVVQRYNADIAEGRDHAFGRTNLGRGWGTLVAIDTAPYYIYPCTTAVLATYCGLRVDAAMRVIDVHGDPIAGLYAAGEIVGGFHGSGYMSGSSLTKSVIFGRVAARTAQEDAA